MTKGLKSLKTIDIHNQHNCKPNAGGTRLRERLESGREREFGKSEKKGFGTLFIRQQGDRDKLGEIAQQLESKRSLTQLKRSELPAVSLVRNAAASPALENMGGGLVNPGRGLNF